MEQDTPPPEVRAWQGIPESHWRAYFGKESGYYMTQLIRWHQGEWPQFSIAAFFLGFLWMAYRKMYLIIVATFILVMVEGTIEQGVLTLADASESTFRGIDLIMRFVIGIAVGTFANRVYLWDARRQIREELAKGPFHIEELMLARITRRGGTSWMFILVLLGALVAFLTVINLFDLAKAFD